ncbi:MAG TPA: LptF/LptG family permease [Tepidisphaeraceae bacterium]|nr:LptF/LptG family permease [Tepidisphaeraceae bacterium]
MRISFTLSRYIFKDLFRIFMMASGALAGIMSFGGLLRPLTQQGLDGAQVGQLLTYFTPAMTAYSFPIAALFATTMVYGRLSADNELTACRAAGISLVSVAIPAFVLGAIVCVISLLFLWFVVPAFTLKAEKVIYSNIAKLVANRIDRTHQIPFGLYTVFAQDAYLPAPETMKRGEQQVVLVGPTIVRFDRPYGRDDWHYKVPREFWTASQATAHIVEREDGKPELTVRFGDGVTFPREFKGAVTAAVGATQFGPVPIKSPIEENTKFMNLQQLREVYASPHESRKIQEKVEEFLRFDQEHAYLAAVRDAVAGPERSYVFQTPTGEEYVLSCGEGVQVAEKGGELILVAPAAPAAAADGAGGSPAARRAAAALQSRPIRVQRVEGARGKAVYEAREARLRVWPRRKTRQMEVSLKLLDAVTRGGADGGASAPRGTLPLPFKVAMPESLRKLEDRPLEYYLTPAAAASGNQNRLQREWIVVKNDVVSEMHARLSFALSCLILVMVGCALGMMFRSGNFLTAFAVSFVPALLSITLIIAGQQACGNVPWTRGPHWENPLAMGTALIWSGNAINFLLAGGLLWRLWRT